MADPRLYFDTSALLPLYRQEKLTAQVEQIQNEVTPVISALTEVEVASTLARWVRMGELTGEQAELLETTFSEDLRLDVFERVALEDRHYWQARHWLLGRKTALRTLDALHLACAVEYNLTIVTADKVLADAAAFVGGRVRFLRG
ncbi:MAG: type II toxin-antitoxin system VapC family toxin [gamma proteobacterium endosymbiont of Lamellibrachia anaximandri]|nr:type II toxin-antitoxin system VapC family toxin [gamma proteobacterium endosymbiont of Lamellibrachia anaximandri]